MAHFEEKNSFFSIFVQFYCFEQKGLFTTNPNFPLDLLLFKLVEKNKLSDCFFFDQKEKFSVKFPENASKQKESIVLLYVAHFEEKNIFC